MEKLRVLLVEDDESLGYLLRSNLEAEGFGVTLCTDGVEGLRTFESGGFHLCILDIMLPKKDGLALGREIRKQNTRIPILYLTAKKQEVDKIKAFILGADDYVTKPFSIKELLLRIRSILRRSLGQLPGGDPVYDLGALNFNYQARVVSLSGEPKTVSAKEAEILKLLLENKGQLVLRNTILYAVWGNTDFFNNKTLDVYLTRLRGLLKKAGNVELKNLYGTGYTLQMKEQ